MLGSRTRRDSYGIVGLPFPSWLDDPRPGRAGLVHSVLVRGWVAVRPRTALEPLTLVIGDTRIELGPEDRPAVIPGRRHSRIVGFRSFVTVTPELVGPPWYLEVRADGRRHLGDLQFRVDPAAIDAFRAQKAAKLARIEPLLRCPAPLPAGDGACHGTLSRAAEVLVCERCGAKYPATEDHFDFLTDTLASLAGVEHTDNVSVLGYDEMAEEVLASSPDGLVLDAGSGLKGSTGRDNVVNLEIVRYPSTDVLGVAESLPFADASLDGALSLAVLEHLRDPFAAVRELARVVRPGGMVYVAVPFLQPYHGYPHHYYNMTLTGLESLLEPWFSIERSGTPRYGWPIWTLTWFLRRWLDGLPPDAARQFKEMKVNELLCDASELLDEGFVTDLDPEAVTDLASVNFVFGARR